jgi:ABC-type transporter Mla subunit MlaD
MASDTSYARLGLFILVAAAVIVATAVFFAERMRRHQVVKLVTYFTEDVTGLEISSPVRYRGVSVGRVSDLRIDPVENAIEVDFEIFQDRLVALGANLQYVREMAELAVQPRLRTRVVSNPISGEAYLLLDTLSNPPPPPKLTFTPRVHYVPSMPSPLSTVQDRLPVVLDRAEATLKTLMETVQQRIPKSLDRGDRFFTSVERMFRESKLPELSADLRAFSTTTTAQMTQITSDMDRVMGEHGTLATFVEEARRDIHDADLPASSKSAQEAADRTKVAADDLRRSLPAVRDALEQLREVARSLEEQPESVLYGPRKPKKERR